MLKAVAMIDQLIVRSLTLLCLEVVHITTLLGSLAVFDERDHSTEVWLQYLLNEFLRSCRQQLLEALRLLAVISRSLLDNKMSRNISIQKKCR